MSIKTVLVNMPFGSVERPSLALSKIEALVSHSGDNPIVLYPNIKFAEMIGLERYYCLSMSCDVSDLVGEWVFANAAFGVSDDAFLDEYLPNSRYSLPPLLHYFRVADLDTVKSALKDIRSQAEFLLDQVVDEVLSHNPDCVGATSVFQQNCASIAVLRRVKQNRPEIRTILGGANCEGLMGEEIKRICTWIDYVHDGRAEGKISQILAQKITEPEESTPIFDAYFKKLESSVLKPKIRPGLLFESSTGCWYGERKHCTFCGLNGKTMAFKDRDPQSVLNELNLQSERYGSKKFEAVDNILSMKYFKSFLPMLASGDHDFQIFYETKSNLSEQHIADLSNAGVNWIQPGIESLDSTALSLMNKGNSIVGNIALLKYAIENGVRVSWNLLIGIPKQDDASYEKMATIIPKIAHLQSPSSIVRIRIDRFSPYHNNPAKYGLTLEPMRSYRYIYPAGTNFESIAYFFDDYGTKRAEADDPKLALLIQAYLAWNESFHPSKDKDLAELTISECLNYLRDTRFGKAELQ